MHRGHPEALASGKLVVGNGSSEGSQTAKSGTDEQERHKRHIYQGEQSQPCEARRVQKRVNM